MSADHPFSYEQHAEEKLQPHDWLLSILVPITQGELRRLETGERVVFKSLNVRDASQVRGSAVFCGRCDLPWERMTETEREDCRGVDED